LQCAFCGNKDYKQLGTIGVASGAGKYRVQTCDVCRGYIKIVVTFDSIPVDQLALEDLATLSLDLIAGERNYGRGFMSTGTDGGSVQFS
jgi:FdhE protein